MTHTPRPAQDAALGAQVHHAFAPFHKRRFGIACGVAAGLLVALMTAIRLLRGPGGTVDPAFDLHLLATYFAGYSVTWKGVLVGFGWGFLVGGIGGWFFAFIRNVSLAVSICLIRTRLELTRTRDFLDHI